MKGKRCRLNKPLFPSLHFTRWMKQWSSLFLFEIFFNIFWQCLLDFFKKNEQIRTGCCLQCMLGQDTNHHPSATSNVWLALTAKGQRDSHVSFFCLTKFFHYVLLFVVFLQSHFTERMFPDMTLWVSSNFATCIIAPELPRVRTRSLL